MSDQSVFGHDNTLGDVHVEGDATGRDKNVYLMIATPPSQHSTTLRTRAQREMARRRREAAMAEQTEARVARLRVRHLELLINLASNSADPLLSEAAQALAAELEAAQ